MADLFSKRLFLRWVWVVSLIAVATVVMLFFGVIEMVSDADPTRLSFVIFAIALAATVWCGRLHWRVQKAYDDGSFEEIHAIENDALHGGYVAEACPALGFLGTLIGMMFAFQAMFMNVNLQDASSVLSSIGTLSSGVFTALMTSVVGLISQKLVDLQFHYLEHAIGVLKDEERKAGS